LIMIQIFTLTWVLKK